MRTVIVGAVVFWLCVAAGSLMLMGCSDPDDHPAAKVEVTEKPSFVRDSSANAPVTAPVEPPVSPPVQPPVTPPVTRPVTPPVTPPITHAPDDKKEGKKDQHPKEKDDETRRLVD